MEKKKDSNVLLGITGAVTTLYGIWSYFDSKFNGGENEQLEKVYQNIGLFDIGLGIVEIAVAFRRERKERKALEEANKKA